MKVRHPSNVTRMPPVCATRERERGTVQINTSNCYVHNLRRRVVSLSLLKWPTSLSLPFTILSVHNTRLSGTLSTPLHLKCKSPPFLAS